MNNISASMAKLAGILKAVQSALEEGSRRNGLPIQNFVVDAVGHYFEGGRKELAVLQRSFPELYDGFVMGTMIPQVKMIEGAPEQFRYGRDQLTRLVRDIEQIFEIRANSELPMGVAPTAPDKRRVFITHGRANDWREVQAYLEKDLGFDTKELAQEASTGMTILGKLVSVSDECDSAVIVMTGDDVDSTGQTRARENEVHEIGFYQGKYGLERVCLLHEEGTNIPSNIHGLVYAPFPRGTVRATFGLLLRELNAMYPAR